MRAIIIEDARFAEFLILLKAKSASIIDYNGVNREMISMDVLEKHGVKIERDGRDNNVIPKALVEAVTNEVLRQMHYEFCIWAQSHGATVTR